MDQEQITKFGTTIGKLFGQMTLLINRSFAAAGYEISIEQFRVLELLAEKEGISQQELAQGLLKTKPNVTHLIDQMEQKGLLFRHSDKKDRRTNLISFTPKGKQVYLQLLELITQTFSDVFNDKLDADYTAFMKTACKLLDRLQQHPLVK